MEEKKEITRRGFLKLIGKGTGAAVGISILDIPGFQKLLAEELAHVPVIWILTPGRFCPSLALLIVPVMVCENKVLNPDIINVKTQIKFSHDTNNTIHRTTQCKRVFRTSWYPAYRKESKECIKFCRHSNN